MGFDSFGSRAAAESERRIRPSAASWTISADVNVLLMLANANAVAGRTGVRLAMSARPLTPVQLDPSGNRIVTEAPGIASFVRVRSRVAWSRASSCSVGVGFEGTTPGGGLDGAGDPSPAIGPDDAPVDPAAATGELALDGGSPLVCAFADARLEPASSIPARPPVVWT